MSDEKFNDLMQQAWAALEVAGDLALQESSKERVEDMTQRLLSLCHQTLALAKRAAVPHQIELQFLEYTLRYPKDCAAADQLDDPWYTERHTYDGIEPKFLGDLVWLSSSNCSDQGLALFSLPDFTNMRWGARIEDQRG